MPVRERVGVLVLAVGTAATIITYAPRPWIGFCACVAIGALLWWHR